MTERIAAVAPPAGRFGAAALMLFLSVCGMAIGLAIDCGVTPPALLATLCATSSGSLATTLSFHVTVMPASYAMMTATAILAAAFNETTAGQAGHPAWRFSAATASVIAMLLGMFAGGWLAPDVATLLGTGPGFGPLVTGMVAGMAGATLVFAAIAHAATARPERRWVQYIMYQ